MESCCAPPVLILSVRGRPRGCGNDSRPGVRPYAFATPPGHSLDYLPRSPRHMPQHTPAVTRPSKQTRDLLLRPQAQGRRVRTNWIPRWWLDMKNEPFFWSLSYLSRRLRLRRSERSPKGRVVEPVVGWVATAGREAGIDGPTASSWAIVGIRISRSFNCSNSRQKAGRARYPDRVFIWYAVKADDCRQFLAFSCPLNPSQSAMLTFHFCSSCEDFHAAASPSYCP
jgi:hypothetical protein